MTAVHIDGLSVRHDRHAPGSRVIDSLDMEVEVGETLGLIGPSGCRNSTLLRVLPSIQRHWQGQVRILNDTLIPGRRFAAALRGNVQMVFQDPYGSLHPLHTVERTVSAPLRRNGVAAVRSRALEALEEVSLSPEFLRRLPHQL